MGRPTKSFTLRRNGDSYQVFINGEYQRSLSVRELVELLGLKERFHTTDESAQG